MKRIAEIIEGRPLYHAASTESVREVARRMTDWNVGAIAIVDDGKLVGVFSERDLMTRVVAAGLDPDGTPIDNVMTKNIGIAEPVEDIDDALGKMYSLKCRHLPVVDSGKLIGMLSLRDLLQIDDEHQRRKASFLKELVTYSPDYES
ncbi:MAG TPA: CBS domain-containing protein [Thermoanaerobaculia bacterium]|nr:CBS domain-containing protein [Thermoanaerobaculia bacterium]